MSPAGFSVERSSGGLVIRAGRVLMVKVRNLSGRVVWTFPKGHIEEGESVRRAALREVEEETGWHCRITGPFGLARYRFRRDGQPVKKTVRWFLMTPVRKTGRRDPEEIMKCRWASRKGLERRVEYPSDKALMARLLKEGRL
jgi:ADP-ribose pyrophosphatase YjhB (NUDIX family)